MGRRHLTTTAVAAGIGTAFTLALVPYASASVSDRTPAAPTASVVSNAVVTTAAADPTRPDATPYLVGGAGFLLAGAGLVVVLRRTG
ncbi:hypothetical protein [Streptacidiphilus rugosus]|uniref:hypothetical protein n=1 Tax=Streptacidiphilus rugosus TaxID=405783 RepID=UPI00056C1090|nr:hypothetical protein [Streptacidiphilus rugosus]